jgi:hypothetical protein
MERYFIKFPTLTYANTECKDITRRVVLENVLQKNPSLYHKYTISQGLRPDMLSASYYEDSYLDWLIYLNNGIVDPYYGWYLETDDFDQFIKKKYGSTEQAMKKVAYFQLNWPTDDKEITPSFYENNLPDTLKKYYVPVFNVNNRIVSYVRKQEDVVTNTNRILHFDVTVNSGNGFVVGEIIDINNNALSEVVGVCEVVFANTSVVKAQHIGGNTAPTNKLVGENSNTIATITNTDIRANNIPDDEYVYWSPVYYYEYENEKNEKNKNIRLLDTGFAMEVAEQLRVALKE